MDEGKKVSSMQPSQPESTLRRRRRRSPRECPSCRAVLEERPSPSSLSGDRGSDERTTVRGHHPTADRRNTRMGGRVGTPTRDRGRRKAAGATTTARMAFVLACLAMCLVGSTSLSLHSDCASRRGNLHGAVLDPLVTGGHHRYGIVAGRHSDGTAGQHGGRWRRLRLPAKFDDDDEADEDDEYLEKFDLDDLASDVQSTASGTDMSIERASPATAAPSSSDADEMRRMMERQQSQIDALMSIMMNQQQSQQSQGQQAQQQEMTAAPRAAPQSPAPGPSVAPLKAFLFIDGTWLYYSMHTRGGDRDPIERKFGKGWRNHYRVDW